MPPETARPSPQPDQIARRWDGHVTSYEEVFEPLTNRFAGVALGTLALAPGARLLDVGAGSGGASLLAAARGAGVTAVDASVAMAARTAGRAAGAAVTAVAADAMALPFADGTFDAALSVFGIVLCDDAAGALQETARAVRPGGAVAVVTWTEPEAYELAARLMAASAAVLGPQPPPAARPAQLRFTAEGDFRALFENAGLGAPAIRRIATLLESPSAAWLGARLGFAPGMAATLERQGARREEVVERFVRDLERDQGRGPVALGAVAFLGTARKQAT